MSNLKDHGSNFFRQRLILSTLSRKPIVIKDIRDAHDEPGVNDYEKSFLELLGTLTDGTESTIMETGTVVKYKPGLLLGGKLQHDCGTERAIGYFLEPLLCLAPFCKKPLQITLRGITNDNVDPSVDAIKNSSLPVLKRFIKNAENLEVKIISRGLPPEGGGEVLFTCPVISTICPLKFLDPGKIGRVTGYAYSVGVSPAMASRMVEKSKGLLLKFLPAYKVYIYTDHCNMKDSERKSKVKKSPGFGLTLVAESTTGVFYSAEAVSNPSGSKGDFVPEDVAQQACFNLFEEINRGGCVDSNSQSMACLLMALGTTDVFKIKTGPLSPYTISLLRHVEDFLQVKMTIETERDEKLLLGTNKVYLTCVGCGFRNLSRKVL